MKVRISNYRIFPILRINFQQAVIRMWSDGLFYVTDMPKRTYTEEDIKKIIAKAMESRPEKKQRSEEEDGITLDELIEYGSDLGLSVDQIKTAALEYDQMGITRHAGLNDTHIFEEREFKAPIPDDVIWEDVTLELNHHFGGDTFGKVKEHPKKKEWIHTSKSGIETVVSLRKRGETAKLRLSQRVGLASPLTEGVAYGLALALVLVIIIQAIFRFSGAALFALGPAIWSISSILVYSLDVAWRKKKLRQLHELADKIISDLPKSIDESELKRKEAERNTAEVEIEDEEVRSKDSDADISGLKNHLKE